jgi:hypothetical protein
MRHAAAAVALFLGLAVLHTWPLASAPARLSLNGNADAQLNEWIVSWVAHILPRHPSELFDANIFAPEPRTLTYSEPLIVPALLGAPVRWLGGSPVLTFNLLLIAGLTLTATSAWFVVWRWTASMNAALVAGALAAFNVHLLTRLPHLQAAHAWGLPLVLYFADRLGTDSDRRSVVGLAAAVAAMAATSLYWLVFAGAIVVLAWLAAAIIAPSCAGRAGLAIAGGSALGLLAASPVLWPYLAFASSGVTRPLGMVAQFSATPGGFLVSTSRLYAGLTKAWFTTDVNVFFPGIVAISLSLAGARFRATAGSDLRRRAILLALIGVAGFVFALGPSTSGYRWAYDWILPLRGLRAAARFGYLFLLAVALSAGYGAAWLETRARSATGRAAIGALLLALVTIEAWQGPAPAVPFAGVPGVYAWLDTIRTPVRLVEMPFYLPPEVFENGEYVLNSTSHWRPLMNGYSGFIPDSYRRRADTLWLFPAEFAMATLKAEAATHVIVHLERYGADATTIAHEIDSRSDLRLVASDGSGHRLYEIRR